ncbi:MAG TPA: sulfatase-like hydrolase/transferase [Thermoanaerobaculia bacterium]
MRSIRIVVVVLIAAWGLTACRRGVGVSPGAPVFLISVDTLRADHLPIYGYTAVETPNLDRFAKDAIVFDNAVSHVPLTLPSHACLFTGLLPFQHGVRDNLGYRLAKSHETLATFLKKNGYATGAAVSAVVLDHASGIAEGFDFYEDSIESRQTAEAIGRVQRPGDQTEKLLEDWIEKQRTGSPLFAFLHLYEPHAPYEPPEPFRARYAAHPYDGEIATSDAIVGRFLDFLKKKKLYESALVVFLSDHGEGLGDHGEDEHGLLLYRESIWVPLIVKLPGAALAGKRVSRPAEIADVFPTVAAVIGRPSPPRLGGLSLVALARGGENRRIYSETLYPRFHFGWSDLAALTDDRYQYIEAPRPELYDWKNDPGEKKDLASGLPPPFRTMRLELSKIQRPMQSPGAEDPETVKKLASLGYIGVAAPAADRKDLPDPKDRIATIDRLKDSARLVSQHRDDEAIALLENLTRENPLMLDGWETLARVLRRAGRTKEAVAALEQADRLTPGTPQLMLGLAGLNREAGNLAKAQSLAEAALTAGAQGAEEELALIALARGDLDTARNRAQAALAARKTSRSPLLLLARVEIAQGHPRAALDLLDSAREMGKQAGQPPLETLEATRGDVLARLGRTSEAEEAFRAETRNFPENLDAWSRLALVYASAGRFDQLQTVLSEMTSRVPTRAAFEAAAKVCDIIGDREGARRWRTHSGSAAAS